MTHRSYKTYGITLKKNLAPLNEVGIPAQDSYLISKDEIVKTYHEKY
jgi:hypothetical protein